MTFSRRNMTLQSDTFILENLLNSITQVSLSIFYWGIDKVGKSSDLLLIP